MGIWKAGVITGSVGHLERDPVTNRTQTPPHAVLFHPANLDPK